MKNLKTSTILTLIICSLFSSNIISQTITSVNPNRGQIGQILNVQISGSNVDFYTGSSSIQTRFKKGTTTITAPPVAVNQSGTVLDVNLNLGNTSLPSGLYDLEMTTPANGLITLPNAFRIDTTALISTTPQILFKGITSNVIIAARALNFNSVTAAPYYFRNNDTIFTTIVQPRTRGNDSLEIAVDISAASVRVGNYDLQVMTSGGPLFLRNALEVKTTNIIGKVYYDANQNGLFDSGEIGVRSRLKLLPSGRYSYSNYTTGNYSFNDIAAGTYDIIVEPETWATPTSPDTQRVVISNPNTYNAQPFGIDLTGNTLYFNLIGSRARCNASTYYRIYTRNYGPIPISGVYYFIKDSLLTYQANTITQADSVSGDTIFYSYNNLQTLQSNQHYIYCDLPAISILPVGTPVLGKAYSYQVNASGNRIAGTDTSDTYSTIVRCSYDPNDKQVSPVGIDSGGYVFKDTRLDYRIRFQNTGNDTAYRVQVIDTLSTNLDLSSFQFIDASHEVITELKPNGELSFTFDNIFLVDSTTNEPASNGYVDFSIKPVPGLPDSTEVRNKAAIYFDFNPPVITNEVLTTFGYIITSIKANKIELKASISPNPSNGNIRISLKEKLNKGLVRVYDLSGKEVYLNEIRNVKSFDLDLNFLSKGVYLLSIIDENKAYTEKVIIE